jgi:hypothetical protein
MIDKAFYKSLSVQELDRCFVCGEPGLGHRPTSSITPNLRMSAFNSEADPSHRDLPKSAFETQSGLGRHGASPMALLVHVSRAVCAVQSGSMATLVPTLDCWND